MKNDKNLINVSDNQILSNRFLGYIYEKVKYFFWNVIKGKWYEKFAPLNFRQRIRNFVGVEWLKTMKTKIY